MVVEREVFESSAVVRSKSAGLAVRRLVVSNFRNYSKAIFKPTHDIVVLTGDNGAGKTNLLEALSLLSPGRGFRRAKLVELDKVCEAQPTRLSTSLETDYNAWAISVELAVGDDLITIGTGRYTETEMKGGNKRLIKINGNPAKSQTELNKYLAVSWLTPQMDRLFHDGANQRRRFFDRLVFAFDATHSTRVNTYNYTLRQHRKLLQSSYRDHKWCLALESQIAETGVAIIAARCDLIRRLSPILGQNVGPFPGVRLSVEGEIEKWLEKNSALEVEDKFKESLEQARIKGVIEPYEVVGPHRSEFNCLHSLKNTPANQCSTGEQKALLISIMLAHGKLRKLEFGNSPLMLLDEVVAHLDELRREALFDLLGSLGSQVWMTGTDASLFGTLGSKADFYEIFDGELVHQ